jgi:sensor domain CHASE-containing protein
MSEDAEDKSFKSKIFKILAIIGGFFVAVIAALLTSGIARKKDDKELEEKVHSDIKDVRNDVHDLNSALAEFHSLATQLQESSKGNSTEDRLDKLENSGVITNRRKKT